MSDANAPHPDAHAGGSFWFSVAGIVAAFLIFAGLLFYAYVPKRPATIAPGAGLKPEQRLDVNLLTPDQRLERLRLLRQHEAEATTTYGWVDREKGIVRLPIDRAMELTARELAKGQGAGE